MKKFMFYKLINRLIKEFSMKNNGQKRKFILVGTINVLLTNLVLQALLLLNFISIPISTLISQFINMIFGYLIYSKFIFNVKFYRKKTFMAKLGFDFGISKNLTAFLIIPIFAIISFIFQKFWVFR